MAIQLKKGDGINLSKDHGVNKVKVELTFDINPANAAKKHEYEVGVMAFELAHKDGKPFCPDDKCFVFYGNKTSFTGAVVHEEDGGALGDDKIDIDFDALDKHAMGIDEVSLISEIYEGIKRGHHLGQFAHCTAHIIHPDTNEVIAEFKLSDEDSEDTAVQMGSFVKDANGHWNFKAVGVGYKKGLADFLGVYGLQAADEE